MWFLSKIFFEIYQTKRALLSAQNNPYNMLQTCTDSLHLRREFISSGRPSSRSPFCWYTLFRNLNSGPPPSDLTWSRAAERHATADERLSEIYNFLYPASSRKESGKSAHFGGKSARANLKEEVSISFHRGWEGKGRVCTLTGSEVKLVEGNTSLFALLYLRQQSCLVHTIWVENAFLKVCYFCAELQIRLQIKLYKKLVEIKLKDWFL